jgi:uncharacterized protein (DUF2267 family)
VRRRWQQPTPFGGAANSREDRLLKRISRNFLILRSLEVSQIDAAVFSAAPGTGASHIGK